MDYDHNNLWSANANELNALELVLVARSMIAARKALHGPLPSDFIHDPALDMLLHLFVAQVAETVLTETGLQAATSVTRPVATRWITALVRKGFINCNDGKVSLSEYGEESLLNTLRAVLQSQANL